MKTVFIFVPAFGQQISATTFMTTHNLQQAFASRGIAGSISTLSFPDIAELRSMVFTIWHDTMPHSNYLLFIDSDMGFAPEMVLDMILFDEPVVGTIYRQRKEDYGWAGSGTGGSFTERRANFMEVEGVGMGCTLIRRDCAALMVAKYPELIDTRLSLHPAVDMMRQAGAGNRLIRVFEKMDIPERGVVSEDLSFCIRWRKLGGKVWGAIGYTISHVGPYDFRGNYLQYVNEKLAQQAMAAQQAAAAKANGQGGPIILPNMPSIVPPAPTPTIVAPQTA